MASGMTGQTSCFNSRWDQSSPRAGRLQGFLGSLSHSLTAPAVSVPSYTGGLGTSTSVTMATSSSFASTVGTEATPLTSLPRAPPPSEDKPAPQGGVELAAAMAAKINAMLMAKGKLKTPQPLPDKIVPTVTISSTADELVVTEVDINDVPINCRNLLTKGKTQEEIRRFSGAVVSTKGFYMTSAEKAQAKGVDRPLYLHVQGKSQEEVNKAVMRIKEIISEDVLRSSSGQPRPTVPTLTVYPQPPRPVAPPPQPCVPTPPVPRPPPPQVPGPVTPQSQRSPAPYTGHSGNFVHTKIFVGLDQALPSFNVNEKVEGPGGSYLQHIQTETGARVFLRGKGSGYIEQASRRESFEPLYLYISHPNSAGLEAAKKLCESLLETVRAEHAQMVSVYTATGSTQAYPSHGYPANSNYSSPVSWYNYPSNGYTGGYAAYPGSSGYWSSANGHPSHSNISTTPQSSQAMVQYPVCPRKPPPYLAQDTATTYSTGNDSPSSSPPHAGSPKRHFMEDSAESLAQEQGCGSAAPTASERPPSPVPGCDEGKDSERMLMPPPPPPPAAMLRKRPREADGPAGARAEMGPGEPISVKKAKSQDASGLVPYGGDSSDEEEDRTHSSKKASL
ncbi:KH homology domain-containing protein 4-like isoform X1 [Megalops cyprinoides]|uniref:KH homology domain-containing protein 4-like isoform X1 n=1 Tax=Megalops cyprinoides TaxID=118141 RepID=UPI001865452F|nr:KH homology domain-containing protein 4-like isoform X1 [Megalops cyprinoides]